MAWRIAPHIIRGEIDNTIKGSVRGKIWISGQVEPMRLELCGHPEPDLAGRRLEFINPKPDDSGEVIGLTLMQNGLLGEFTAARKVKIPAIPIDQLLRSNGKFPFRWSESLYLEWFSESNGRVVIQSTGFELTRSEPIWELSSGDRAAQQELNATAWDTFMKSLAISLNAGSEAAPSEGSAPIPVLDPDAQDQDAIERLLRINELKHEAERLSEGQMTHEKFAPMPLAVEEQFWKNVVEFEKASRSKRSDLLARDGISLPAPDQLNDEELTDAMWAVIHGLAEHGMYLLSTGHLSDRELYSLLIDSILEEEITVPPRELGWVNHILVEEYDTAEEECHLIYLRYYATDEERRRWAIEFPEDHIPEHEEPPYDRDRHLPRENW